MVRYDAVEPLTGNGTICQAIIALAGRKLLYVLFSYRPVDNISEMPTATDVSKHRFNICSLLSRKIMTFKLI